MKNEEKFEEVLKKMVTNNIRNIEINEQCSSNIHFIGKNINLENFEEKLQDFCNVYKISLKVIDVLEEENQKTVLLNLFDELNYNNDNNCYMLYLKNYTKTRPTNVRYRFSCIYKDQCAPNSFGIVTKENLQYLGTVIFSLEDDVFPLDDSESSCFLHVEI